MFSKQNLIVFLVLILSISTQESLQDSVAAGVWSGIFKENRVVPRYYLCGAQMSQFRNMAIYPTMCRVPPISCPLCKIECQSPPSREIWVRSESIQLTYCNYLKWEDQFTTGKIGQLPFKGIKMCPPNQLVYGFQGKLSERDGLSGLNLFCRNPKNISQVSQIKVIDGGLGQWGSIRLSSNYAYRFQVKNNLKYNIDYISGFRAHFLPLPQINSFDLKYEVPANIQAFPETINSKVVINRGNSNMKKMIDGTNNRVIQRIWINQKTELAGEVLSKYFTQSFSFQARIKVLNIKEVFQESKDLFQANTVNSYERMEKFAFGQTEKVTVGQKTKDEIEVKPCTKMMISQIVYSSTVNIHCEYWIHEWSYLLGGLDSRPLQRSADQQRRNCHR